MALQVRCDLIIALIDDVLATMPSPAEEVPAGAVKHEPDRRRALPSAPS